MSGFPTRPALADFGPTTMLNARPVLDADIEPDAAHWNLLKFQAAGMGLLSPRILAKLTINTPTALLAHVEAWNPAGSTSGNFAAPTPTYISTGRCTLTYLTPVPDLLGNDIAIAFSWAHAFVHADPPTTFRSVQATPIAATPHIITVCVFDAAGALQNGSDVWLMAG